MKEKIFYVMCKKGNVKGAVKRDGYQAERDGNRVYIYRSMPEHISVIDPETGLLLFTEYCKGRAAETEELIFTHSNMEKIRMAKELEAYPLLRETFQKYKEAAIQDEKNRCMIDKMMKQEDG